MKLSLQSGGEHREVEVTTQGDAMTLRFGDVERALRVVGEDENALILEVDGRRHRIHWASLGGQALVQYRGRSLRVGVVDEDEAVEAAGGSSPVVRAPMPGKVLEILVAEGDRVEVGQPVIRVEAMKMEVELNAEVAGRVARVHAEAGRIADPEEPLVTIQPDDTADGATSSEPSRT